MNKNDNVEKISASDAFSVIVDSLSDMDIKLNSEYIDIVSDALNNQSNKKETFEPREDFMRKLWTLLFEHNSDASNEKLNDEEYKEKIDNLMDTMLSSINFK